MDEVPNAERETVLKQLAKLIDDYPANYCVVSPRREAVAPEWCRKFDFREVWINPLSVHDIRRFIRQWHAVVAHELDRQGRRDDDLPT
jgi:hypothetical protein